MLSYYPRLIFTPKQARIPINRCFLFVGKFGLFEEGDSSPMGKSFFQWFSKLDFSVMRKKNVQPFIGVSDIRVYISTPTNKHFLGTVYILRNCSYIFLLDKKVRLASLLVFRNFVSHFGNVFLEIRCAGEWRMGRLSSRLFYLGGVDRSTLSLLLCVNSKR